ncbi:hypothetical protein F5J12DRAFT_781581 [Pisolithus orientalis]|uniref:uncharacterized protein n=1 Tax=Pisolithus orientalis TaxID=936130 RepID=UPI0022241A3C|nr:uncharacterized protein F5J12DRAFT_781581 [Pisolithus orientalis]KAI6012703.1 hypothetical protein F5J12DRAFT_781581 [Pisolithus orientalis]
MLGVNKVHKAAARAVAEFTCDLIQSRLGLSRMFVQCLRSKRSTRHIRYIYNFLAAVLGKRFRECRVEMFGTITQGLGLYSRLGSLRFDTVVNNIGGTKVTPRIFERNARIETTVNDRQGLLSQHDLNSAATGGSSGYVLTRDFLLMQPNPCGRPQAWIDGPIGSERFGFSATGFYVSKFPYETHYSHFCQGWEASSESGCIVGIADLLPPTSRGTPHNGRSQYSKGLEKKLKPSKLRFVRDLHNFEI